VSPKVKKDQQQPWTGDPLPRGRHKLPREEVRASQRERLLRAMGELVGEKGYEATTVPQVIAAARVSSNTFYSFFADKTDCFIALCEQLGDELFEALLSGPRGPTTPEEGLAAVDRGIKTYLSWWRDRPALARAYFVELPMAGRRAMEERERQYQRFEAIHRAIADQARVIYPDAPPLRDVDVKASVILATELAAQEVREGRVESIDELEDDLRYLLMRLLVGESAAQAVARDRLA
jgi:AcrR family transcriptional regulator